MKKKFLLAFMMLVFGFMGVAVYANDVYPEDISDRFYDVLLREAILEHINYEADEADELVTAIYDTAAEGITVLDISGLGIYTLEGLEYLTALTVLDVSDNNLTRLHLPNNLALIEIDASNNNLSFVDLRPNTFLELVDLRGNEMVYELPENFVQDELYEFLFHRTEEYGYDDAQYYDDDNDVIFTTQIKAELFNAIDWDAVVLGPPEDRDVYMHVVLRHSLGQWHAHDVSVFYMEDGLPAEEPDTLVVVFSWILVVAAILSFLLSIVLFLLRKE